MSRTISKDILGTLDSDSCTYSLPWFSKKTKGGSLAMEMLEFGNLPLRVSYFRELPVE